MDNIYHYIDKKKLKNVLKPIHKANGLPNECYSDGPYNKVERKKIFENNWAVIGTSSSLPKTGNIKSINFLGIPLIMVRDKNQNIKVFHNVCSHRGYKLVKEDCKHKNLITCPYHSWTYNLNGDLISTPHIGGVNIHSNKNFKKNQNNLKQVRSFVWLDLIFINISNKALSFKEYIRPLEKRWKKFISKEDYELIVKPKDYGYFNFIAKCNWKFAIENFCESYHLPFVHPNLNKYSKIDDHYNIQGLPNRFAGQGTLIYNPKFKNKFQFPIFPSWPINKQKEAEYIALFPNVMLGMHKDHFYAFWLEPINYKKTIEHMEIYYVGKDAAFSNKYKKIRKENFIQWKNIMTEDLDIIEGMQEGRNSPSYNGGNFSPVLDNPTHHFAKWVVNSLII